MKCKTREFNAGDEVACYSGEIVEFGRVLSLETGRALVAIERGFYEGNEQRSAIHLQEYFYREIDGLYVAARCDSEYVPSKMIVGLSDMGIVNKWRYRPSVLEKVKRKFKTVGRLRRDNSPEGIEDAAKYWRI